MTEPDWDAAYKASIEDEPRRDVKELARELLAIGELGKRVKAADAALRARYAALADPGDRAMWRVDAGQVGSVALANGATYARVSDGDALLAWMRTAHPTEVHTVEQVRAAYLTRLLATARDVGEAVDPDTGESVPGISVEVGSPTVRVAPAKGAGALIEAEWAAGRLPVPGSVLPQITSGGEG